MPIRVLSSLLVNQIAAGEVIERPASVVKELVENSLDAGATRVEIATEAGGRDLIEVRDDGHGIPADELALALAPHATSKIAETGDLDAIFTMGFRGEALASIASVAQVRIRSCPRNRAYQGARPSPIEDWNEAHIMSEVGAEIVAEGDRIGAVRPAAAPPGTSITVRNLFFNVPARRKFMRTDTTESTRIAEAVAALAIAHPHVGFRLRQDGRDVLDLAPDSAPRRRAVEVIGSAHDADLLEVGHRPDADADSDDHTDGAGGTGGAWLRIWGLAGTPALARANGKAIRIFVNGRTIVDRSITHAVREAYRGLIDPARYPTAAILLRVDPRMVDVNVHPTKAEVRFRSASAVHGAVLRAVRSALRSADLIPSLHPDWSASSAADAPDHRIDGAASSAARPITAPWTSAQPASGGASMVRDSGAPAFPVSEVRAAIAGAASLPAPVAEVPVLQAHRRYLVLEDEQGIRIIDQHALHERLMFERIRERLGLGPLPSQRLLTPVMVPADAGRRERMEECGELLRRLGLELTDAGAGGIAVHAFPSLLLERRVQVDRFVGELLDRTESGDLRTDEEAALASVVSMMACKSSVRSGDRLPQAEIGELLRQCESIERSTACPHGRPTTLRVSLKELDRHFGRS